MHPLANPARMRDLQWAEHKESGRSVEDESYVIQQLTVCFVALAHTVGWEVAAASCMVANSKTIFEVKLPPQQQRFTLTH